MRGSVPSARYSSICNVLRQWKTSLIPIYRVYRLYDSACLAVQPLPLVIWPYRLYTWTEKCVGFMAEGEEIVGLVLWVVSFKQLPKLNSPAVVDTLLQVEPVYVTYHALPDKHNVRTQESLHFGDYVLQALSVVEVTSTNAC